MGSGLQASEQVSALSGGQLCLRGVLVLAFQRCAYLNAWKQRTALAYGKEQPLTKDVIGLGGDKPPCPAQVGIYTQMTQCSCCLQNPFFVHTTFWTAVKRPALDMCWHVFVSRYVFISPDRIGIVCFPRPSQEGSPYHRGRDMMWTKYVFLVTGGCRL